MAGLAFQCWRPQDKKY